MPQKELSDLVNDIKNEKECENWDLRLKVEGIYELYRKREGVCETRLYMEIEEDKFGYAYIVINPLGKTLENGKGHCPKEDFKKVIRERINNLNMTYFTKSVNQEHSAPTQQSSS